MSLALVTTLFLSLALVTVPKIYNIPIIRHCPKVIPNKDSPHRVLSRSMIKIWSTQLVPLKNSFFRTRFLLFLTFTSNFFKFRV